MNVKLARPVRFLERQWPWALIGIFFSVIFSIAALIALSGAVASVDPFWFSKNLRGYTAIGLGLGIVSVFLILFAFAYVTRKRRAARHQTTMMTWLWVHVYVGLLAIVAAALHAGFGLVSVTFSTGKVAFWTLAAVVFGGIGWRIAYGFVPGAAAPKVYNYSSESARVRAQEYSVEIEKLAAGRSPAFHHLKDALLVRLLPQGEIHSFAQSMPPADHGFIAELVRLSENRLRTLSRLREQQRFTRLLQGWRIFHVPLALFFVLTLLLHVVFALGADRMITPPTIASQGPLAHHRPSSECASCHATLYDQWANSMHAHALTSPITVVQNNLDIGSTLADVKDEGTKRMCINCHAPAGAHVTKGDLLPLAGGPIANEGIGCTSCHQMKEAPEPGAGALIKSFQDKFSRDDTYFGWMDSPVGNAYHQSATPSFNDPNQLCASCHDVNLDRDGDRKIVKGVDLVLQTTYDEYREYRAGGGKSGCVDCHMAPLANATRAADGAALVLEQDYPAPDRVVHDHSFVGVDYPLDTVKDADPQKGKREALLRSAVKFDIDTPKIEGDNVTLHVTLENLTGHGLPTGFAFARQMWLEVIAKDARQNAFFVSGKIDGPAQDLCDASTFGESTNPLRLHVVGCTEVDKHLVNFQLKLVDKIVAASDKDGKPLSDERGGFVLAQSKTGNETMLQFITGGPVARVRPIDKTPMIPIPPLGKRTLTYTFPLPRNGLLRGGNFTVRLLFRNLPPYFVRAMAKDAKNEPIKLDELVNRLQIVEMAKKSGTF